MKSDLTIILESAAMLACLADNRDEGNDMQAAYMRAAEALANAACYRGAEAKALELNYERIRDKFGPGDLSLGLIAEVCAKLVMARVREELC